MRNLYLIVSLLFIAVLNGHAQDKWQKILGGDYTDESNAILLTSDGYLLVGGSTESFSQSDREGYLAKMTLSGQLVWEKTYNTGSFWNPIYDVAETPKHTFITTGATWNNACASGNAYSVECNALGNTLWQSTFCDLSANFHSNEAYSVALTPDSGFVFCGAGLYQQSQGITIFKTDQQGEVEWAKGMGSPGWDVGTAAVVTQDGNVVLVGSWAVVVNGQTDGFLAKLSMQNGDTLWTNQIKLPGYESFQDLIELSDGTLLVAGTNSGRVWILHFSASGQLLNQQTISPNPPGIQYPNKMIATTDGGFAVVGVAFDSTNLSDRNGFLVKLAANGSVQWQRQYGGPQEDNLSDVVQLPDGGFCMAGNSKGFGDPNGDAWIIRTDSLGNTAARTIHGTVYVDENLNCSQDAGEIPFPDARLQISNSTESILRRSDSNGNYSSLATVDNYTITASASLPYWTFCNNPQSLILDNTSTEGIRDFGVQVAIACPYISLDLSIPFLRRCDDGRIYGQICNTGSAAAPYTEVRITLDSFLVLDSASVPYLALPNNTFLLATDSLGLFECNNFLLYVTTSCDAPLSWWHCINGYAFPDTLCHPDADTAFVAVQECLNNTGSYDPNDKRAFPPGDGDEHWIAPNTEIKYQIRFQNTGTDTAFQVVIIDTLSTMLDPLSFRTGAFSHPYRLEWLADNVVKFIFSPIALPDSNQNESASHGFLNFYLRPRADISIGSRILNSAAIYFDANTPVLTNTYYHTIGQVSAVRDRPTPSEQLRVSPNPANSYILVQAPESYIGGEIWLTDILGRVRFKHALNGEQEQLDISALSGWYNVVLLKAGLPVLNKSVFID